MESNWSQGYVTEVLYTEHFFRELSPSWLNYVATISGCHPRPLTEGFTYLELGCGLGHSVGLMAGAFPQGRFYGVDFNPAHIDSAQRYSARVGILLMTEVPKVNVILVALIVAAFGAQQTAATTVKYEFSMATICEGVSVSDMRVKPQMSTNMTARSTTCSTAPRNSSSKWR